MRRAAGGLASASPLRAGNSLADEVKKGERCPFLPSSEARRRTVPPKPYDPTLKALVENDPGSLPALFGHSKAPTEVIDADAEKVKAFIAEHAKA